MRLHRVHLVAPLAVGLCLCVCFSFAYDAIAVAAESCWSREDVCVIHATLQPAAPSSAVDLSMDIACPHAGGQDEDDDADATDSHITHAAYALRPSAAQQQLLLDGCHTPPFRTTTYGFELLPSCDRISKVTVQRFRGDVLQRFDCVNADASHGARVHELRLRQNEIGTVPANALANLAQLREIYFTGNSLRHIERTAFDKLPALELLQLERETLLALKEADVLARTSVAALHLSALKQLTPLLFQQLPHTLRHLYVAHTAIDGGTVAVTNPQLLHNISLIDCGLRGFTLLDAHASVLFVNLSGNAIAELRVETSGNNTPSVETLDLSENRLSSLQWRWLQPLSKLRRLLLRGNLLKTLSLAQLLTSVPAAHFIDLRDNELVALRDTVLQLDYDHTRIQIDGNPWNCLWLLNFAHSHPEQFRIFLYDKFISQINVNGLACNPEESLPLDMQLPAAGVGNATERTDGFSSSTEATFANVSTYTLVYGSPWDYKRNQRAEALIIVFMLPLGIAFLFLLLYMWIYCQRMFHLSYYRSMPLIGTRATPVSSAERFDVVRQLPPTASSVSIIGTANNNEDYEMPMNGSATICNCNHLGAANGGVGNKCHKMHHITYVAIPAEEPYKIYEEILDEPGDAQAADAGEATAPDHSVIYDHLSFTEAAEEDM